MAKGKGQGTGGKGQQDHRTTDYGTGKRRSGETGTRRNGEAEKFYSITLHALRITNHALRITLHAFTFPSPMPYFWRILVTSGRSEVRSDEVGQALANRCRHLFLVVVRVH